MPALPPDRPDIRPADGRLPGSGPGAVGAARADPDSAGHTPATSDAAGPGGGPAGSAKHVLAPPGDAASDRATPEAGRPGPRRARPACTPPGPSRPLPDPAVVRMFRVPESAPPYDRTAGVGADDAATAGQYRTDRQAERRPDGGPQEPARGQAAEPRGSGAEQGRERPGGPTVAGGRPTAPSWPGQFAQVLVETLSGARPARQMAPWTTEQVRERIARLGPQLLASERPRVLRVITARPTPAAVEMTVLLDVGSRVKALAIRLERDCPDRDRPGHTGVARWRCTALEAA